MKRHTPGPWQVVDRGHSPWTNALVIVAPDGGDVAYTTRGGFFYDEPDPRAGEQAPSWPNGRPIAAAPELLAALKVAVETIRLWHGPDEPNAEVWTLYQQSPEMRCIAAAIAKAEGA